MKATSQIKMTQKNDDYLKKENDLESEDDLKNEDTLRIKEDSPQLELTRP